MNGISDAFVNLPDIEVEEVLERRPLRLKVKFTGTPQCPHCQSTQLIKKDKRRRTIRHFNLVGHAMWLLIDSVKHVCEVCKKYFWQRFGGIKLRSRHTEPFKDQMCQQHHRGITAIDLSRDFNIGHATISRWYVNYLHLFNREYAPFAPRIMGIDEKFFTRKQGFATTICNLRNNTVFDIRLGRSEASLERYFTQMPGKEHTRVVVMDLSTTYRSIIEKHFPRAKIVADRFHVIRTVNHHFMNVWKMLDPSGKWNRGLLSLMRRHRWRLSDSQKENLKKYLAQIPGLEPVYEFKQELTELLLHKNRTARHCRRLIPKLLWHIEELLKSGFESMRTLGKTLRSWQEEIVRMWRFSKSNGITEGFHTKMEMMKRRAYGFRNFENYRMKVRVMCSKLR